MAKGGRGTAFPVPTAVAARISRLTWAGWLTARACAIMPPIDHPSTAGRRSLSAEIRALVWLVMAVMLSEAGPRRRGPADAGVVEDHNLVMGGQGIDDPRRPAVHGCARSHDEQQRGPAAQLAVRDRPVSGVDDLHWRSQYIRPLLPEDPHAARAAVAQHTASSRLAGNLMCCVRACIMATCFRDEQPWRHRDWCMRRLPGIIKIYLFYKAVKIYLL